MPGRVNGTCHLTDQEWVDYRERANRMEEVVRDLHNNTERLVLHTKHLDKLEVLPEIKDKLLEAATGRTQFDVGIAKLLFTIMGIMLLGQTFIIVFLLTGHKMGLVDLIAK